MSSGGTGPASGAGGAPRAAAGSEIAGRYRLSRCIGRGAHGEVWAAEDQLAKRPVAVKLLDPGVEVPLARIQLEVAALRQRVPGVVELFDDGVEDGRAYLVMELVQGEPFPGVPKPCAWADIAEVTAALLETLARLHASALVHRDLKPANVLVTGRQVRVLDFGIAYPTVAAGLTALHDPRKSSRPPPPREPFPSDRLTDVDAMMGTPAYAAPEQLRNEAVSEETDLYAIGVMLYEALSGALPHSGESMAQLLGAKLLQRPAPLAQVAPDVPVEVARVVDRMLETEVSARPRSATEVLALLAGQPSAETTSVGWLGPMTPLVTLAQAVRADRSIDVIGPRGSGRTRCLRACAEAVEAQRAVVWLRAGTRAFESLADVVGELAEHADGSLAQVAAVVDERIRHALADGTVLLADDAERLDSASAAALARCLDAGPIVRAFVAPRPDAGRAAAGSVELAPLREEDLRILFAGPDLLLHLREDAARVLHRRTDGRPGRIVRELTTWVRLGVARWLRNLLVVQRDALDRLESGFLAAAPIDIAAEGAAASLAEPLADVLAWVTFAWPHTDVALLARAMGEPRFRVEADVEALLAAGLVRRLPDGRIEPRAPLPAPRHWTADRTQRAHESLAGALAPGTTGRIQHLLLCAGGRDDARLAIGAEAAALAERLIDEGRLGEAVAAVETGVRSLRRLGQEAEVLAAHLLGLWVAAAIEDGKPYALDRALYSISRVETRTEAIERLEALARAALKLEEWSDRPLGRAEGIAPFADRRLERARRQVLLRAARRVKDDQVEERLLDEIAASMDPAEAERDATLDTWRGRLRYRQGRFAEAAALHARAAERTSSVLFRIYSMMSGALALLEAFAFDQARELAERTVALAAQHRHAYYETVGRWIARAVAYRTDDAQSVDRELVQSVPHVGVKELEATVYMNEAAVASRLGDAKSSVELARKALSVFLTIGLEAGVLIARGLLLLHGSSGTDSEARRLCRIAQGGLLPGVGIQGLALLALAGRLPRDAVDDAAIESLAATVPAAFWDRRMDVLSVNESLAAIRHARA